MGKLVMLRIVTGKEEQARRSRDGRKGLRHALPGTRFCTVGNVYLCHPVWCN